MMNKSKFKHSIHEIIFEADTAPGKWFDVVLIFSIIVSVVLVMLDSVVSLHVRYRTAFDVIEWFFTALFTIEYVLRLLCVGNPLRYAKSFFGVVDVLAILPTYLSLLLPALPALAQTVDSTEDAFALSQGADVPPFGGRARRVFSSLRELSVQTVPKRTAIQIGAVMRAYSWGSASCRQMRSRRSCSLIA